jgi:hypothetical protein
MAPQAYLSGVRAPTIRHSPRASSSYRGDQPALPFREIPMHDAPPAFWLHDTAGQPSSSLLKNTRAAPFGAEKRLEMLIYSHVNSAFSPLSAFPGIRQSAFRQTARLQVGYLTKRSGFDPCDKHPQLLKNLAPTRHCEPPHAWLRLGVSHASASQRLWRGHGALGMQYA